MSLNTALKYIVERGLTDAETLFKAEEKVEELRGKVNKALKGRRRGNFEPWDALPKKALKAAEGIEADTFTTPESLIERTRKGLAIVETAYILRQEEGNPFDLEEVAEFCDEVDSVEEVNRIAGCLVLSARDTYAQLLAKAGIKSNSKPADEQVEQRDEAGVNKLLIESLASGAIDPENQKKIKEALKADLGQAMARCNEKGIQPNHAALNHYSYYFREFGHAAFGLLQGTDLDSLEAVLGAKNMRVLRKALSKSRVLNKKDERSLVWAEPIDSETLKRFCEIDNEAEMIAELEDYFNFKTEINASTRPFNLESTKKVLTWWSENKICIRPRTHFFTSGGKAVDQLIENWDKCVKLFRQNAVPLKAQLRLINDFEGRNKFLKRKAVFEAHGMTPTYYLPYMSIESLHVPTIVAQAVNLILMQRGATSGHPLRIKYSIVTQDRVEAIAYLESVGHPYSDFDERVSPERAAQKVQLFTENDLEFTRSNITKTPLGEIRERIKKNVKKEKAKRQALIYLESIGFPYDELDTELRPDYIAKKARMLIKAGARVTKSALTNMTPRQIREKIKLRKAEKKKKLEAPKKLQEMLRVRNLNPPEWVLRLNGAPQRIIYAINYIESLGLRFDDENLREERVYWSWLNLSYGEIRRKANKKLKKIDKTTEYEELMRTRKLPEPPPWLLKKGSDWVRPFVVGRIAYIEARGVAVTAENFKRGILSWSLFNAYGEELDRRIYNGWEKLDRGDKYDTLSYLYDVDIPTEIRSSKDPNSIWQRFRAAKIAGIELTERQVLKIRGYSRGDWVQWTRDNSGEEEIVSRVQRSRLKIIQKAKEVLNWNKAAESLDCLPLHIFEMAGFDLEAGQGGEGDYEQLKSIAERYKKVTTRLIRAQASFADLDYFLDYVPLEELEDKIELFKSNSIKIHMLYLPIDEIRSELA